jgi:hypothetical protein
MLHLLHKLVSKPLGNYREPVDIRARILDDSILFQTLAVVGVEVTKLPVIPVVKDNYKYLR